ncbi:MAG: TonB-dependent receptor [Gammaproteobacteria bacterium]|nr:TonB-dependent receptor [Gammaproteobacteria bacterium]
MFVTIQSNHDCYLPLHLNRERHVVRPTQKFRHRMSPKIYITAFTTCALALTTPIVAQDEAPAQQVIEEIIVTATKRAESIQDVPIAVSAITGYDLYARGVEDLYGLAEVAPSLAVYSSNSTSNGGTLRIRGVGTTGNNPGLEAAVGTFIDGVYRSRAGLAFKDLPDIARVEILRGPQGTLFGKNTVAGAVNIVTNAPEFETSLSASLGVDDNNGHNAGFTGNAALSDDIAGRVSFATRTRDGFYNDVNSDSMYDGRDRYNLRGQLLWRQSDQLDVRIIADYAERNESCCPAAFWIAGPTSAAVAGLGGDVTEFRVGGDANVGTNYEPYENVEDSGISIDALWELDAGSQFRSITAIRDFSVARGQDIDFTSADILHPQDSDETFRNFSQEFQLFGETDTTDWLVGAYLYTEDLESDEYIVLSTNGGNYIGLLFGNPAVAPLFMGDPAGRGVPGQGYDAVYFSDTRGWALFTHDVWHVNPSLDVTFGLRYSWEEKDAGAVINGAPYGELINDPFCNTFGGISAFFSLCDNLSWNNVEAESALTGTLKAAFHLNDDVRNYVSYSRGYKAGGFNLDQEAVGNRDASGNFVDQSRFDPETSDSLELGVKVRALGGRLTVNSALFRTSFRDFQLNTFTGLGFTVGNVKEVTSTGIEVESSVLLGGGISAKFWRDICKRALRQGSCYKQLAYRPETADTIATSTE